MLRALFGRSSSETSEPSEAESATGPELTPLVLELSFDSGELLTMPVWTHQVAFDPTQLKVRVTAKLKGGFKAHNARYPGAYRKLNGIRSLINGSQVLGTKHHQFDPPIDMTDPEDVVTVKLYYKILADDS